MTGILNSFCVLQGASSYSYNWILVLSKSGSDLYPYIAKQDNLGNIYVTASNFTIASIKLTQAANLAWQKTLTVTGVGGLATGSAIDNSYNLYGIGTDGSASPDAIFWKRNSNGVLQGQIIVGTVGVDDIFYGIAIDSSDNIYVGGLYNDDNALLIKYNTAGTIQWQRDLTDVKTEFRGVSVDSSGNIYAAGYTRISGDDNALIAKYNSSGTLQWQRILGNVGDDISARGVTTDSSGNVYYAGIRNTGAALSGIIVKYNSSGTIQWQKELANAGYLYFDEISVDSNNNLYVVGQSTSSEGCIAKYNSSGVLQWQANIDLTSGADLNITLTSVVISTQQDILVGGACNNVSPTDRSLLFMSLPNDGSKTGTYTVGGYSIQYATSSFTDSTPSYTESAGSSTSGTPSVSTSTSSFTDGSGSYTPSAVNI